MEFPCTGVFYRTLTSSEMTPLHLAAIHGHRGVAQLLLALGADVDARVYQRYGSKCEKLCTALYLATICGDLAVVRALIEAGADVNTAFGQQ
jgi:ankyrin repeat protein